jgi:D-alanyl-D-alanine carboxypeptidase
MTYYVASRRLEPQAVVRNVAYSPTPGESLAGFRRGEATTVRDLLLGLMLASGNDAAATLAARATQTEAGFVARMNTTADRLGLARTTYTDPIGLGAGNVSSPHDLVDLAIELRRSARFRRIVAASRASVRSGARAFVLKNRNRLVRKDFVDGVKTGSTLEAGYILVASAHRGGVGLVRAVLGATGEGSRDRSTLRLLDYGFSLYHRRAVVEKGQRIGAVALAGGGRLPIKAEAGVHSVARADQRAEIRVVDSDPVEGLWRLVRPSEWPTSCSTGVRSAGSRGLQPARYRRPRKPVAACPR